MTISILLLVPPGWGGMWQDPLSIGGAKVYAHGVDEYDPNEIDYAVSFRPPPGLLRTLPKLKAVFSLGAGVDGFLLDPDFPKDKPLIRFVDETLSREMAQFAVLHVLTQHRTVDFFGAAQAASKWRQRMLPRRTEDARVGILGLGEIGTVCAERLRDLGFPVSGWSRSRKEVAGVTSFAGADTLEAFLAGCDFLVCVLPLTADTRHILNAKTFAMLPKGAYVINIARGGHVNEADLIAALDSEHLSGATLDVFETEPLPETSPIWKHPRIIATPHVAAITSPAAATNSILSGIAAIERGETPKNVVDMGRGY
ncbi:MAG TPA: glyoxylate/hydroxypyruvate reductase A [Rhizomicrobium sp.]|jgi:glyoxylate/hydroxypyruvate reductase A|nr:glyoxylate/hydroxypyruvate reductase A [Rhizomicrobium sp.]